MNQDQLTQLAQQFVEIKAPFADEEFKKELAEELRGKIEETIELELVSAMTPDQLNEYNELLDKKDTNDENILEYINKCNINLDVVTSSALTRFRVAYLGA